MRKQFCLLATILCLFVSGQAFSGNKIKYYFNHTVDNTVSQGVNAVNLNGNVDDTLIAYINRAKYTIDVAVYNFTLSSISNVATAINNAYSRGVKVRWIYDGGSTNSGLASVNSAIPRLGSPTSSSYTIMHNKFMIIDANSPASDDAIVWTGSTNWSDYQFNTDYNNIVILQDSALAHAYRAEFNMMWGDTSMTPNAAASKFGSFKTDLGRHDFTIDGKHVELYFSPSDRTNDHIVTAINSANKDMYLAMYTLTYNTNANAMVARKNAGIYVASIVDQFSNTYTAFTTLNTALGSNFKEYARTGIYHNKYLIVDPSDACSDPLVLTGSHNWSSSANTDNDENTLIIHDDTAANIYYQSFRADFTSLGASLLDIAGCRTAVSQPLSDLAAVSIFPNPSSGKINVLANSTTGGPISISMLSIDGRVVRVFDDVLAPGTPYTKEMEMDEKGTYFIKITSQSGSVTQLVYLY